MLLRVGRRECTSAPTLRLDQAMSVALESPGCEKIHALNCQSLAGEGCRVAALWTCIIEQQKDQR